MADVQRGQQQLEYANAPVVRTSPAEIVLGIIALACGIVLILLAAVIGIFNLRSNASWADRFIPIVIMAGAGGLA